MFVNALDYIGEDFYESRLWHGYKLNEEYLTFELETYGQIFHCDPGAGIEVIGDGENETGRFKLNTIFFYLSEVEVESGNIFTGILPDRVPKDSSMAAILTQFGKPSRTGKPYILLGKNYGPWVSYYFRERQYHFQFMDGEDRLSLLTLSFKIPD